MQPTGALAHQYAVAMDNIFRENHPDIPLDADSFDIRPREALEEALEYLRLDGRIQEGEIADLLNDYDFGDSNLRTFFEKKDGEEKYKELIARITDIMKRWRSQ